MTGLDDTDSQWPSRRRGYNWTRTLQQTILDTRARDTDAN